MASIFIASTFASCLLSQAMAQSGPMSLCTGLGCEECPNSITTSGTGYPACVVYDRDTVLGSSAGDYANMDGDLKNIFYDIAPQTNPECKTIIRSPASTTDPNCGYPIYAGPGGVCFNGPGTKSTFMIQFCCGTGDCTAAGASKRDDNSAVASSVVLRDINNNILVPQSVGDSAGEKMDIFMEDLGLNSSTVLRTRSTTGVPIFQVGYEEDEDTHHTAITKRDCDTYIADGAPYTKTGDVSTQIRGYICGETTTVGITNEVSVSQTTTFSASVGDPFGVVSASVGFEIEESASQSTTYEFTPLPGQCGHVAFTPFYTCTSGTITGCEGGDQNGEVCTAKRVSDDRIDGAYAFVQTE